jgi:hypothetical protein
MCSIAGIGRFDPKEPVDVARVKATGASSACRLLVSSCWTSRLC